MNISKIVNEAELRADLEKKFRAIHEKAVEAYEKFQSDKKKIEANPELSDIGKLKKIQALADALRIEIEAIRRGAGYNNQISEIEQKLNAFPVDDGVDRVVDMLRQIEVRGVLRDKDPLEIINYLTEIMDDFSFVLLVRAIENAIFPLVPSDELERLKRERSERINPRLVLALDFLKTAQMNLNNFCDMVINDLISGGYHDPVRDISEAEM